MVTLADELAREEARSDRIEDNDNDEVNNEEGWIDEMEDLTNNRRIELRCTDHVQTCRGPKTYWSLNGTYETYLER